MADLPDWQTLDGVQPPSGDGGGRVVGLVASEEAAVAGWSASAAVELARSWSRQGRRVVLVDGVLEAPSLHDAAGVKNREGLTDAALYGVSVGRVSHPVDGFFLVTAGTPVADASAVVRSGRWHRLAHGMTEAGADLLLYLRDGQAGTAAFLGSASDIVVLAGPSDPAPAAVGDLAPLVRAVTGSDGAAPAAGRAAATLIHADPLPADPTSPDPDPFAESPDSEVPAGVASDVTPHESAGEAGTDTALDAGWVGTPGVAPSVEGGGGFARMMVFVLGALLTAAGLGYLFFSML